MTPEEAQNVIDAFHIIPVVATDAKQIVRFHSDTATYAIAHAAELQAVVHGNIGNLRNLMLYLDKGKPLFKRCDTLIAINDVCGLTLCQVMDNSPLIAEAALSDQCIALKHLDHADKVRLRQNYGYAHHAMQPKTEEKLVEQIVRLFIGRPTDEVLDVMDLVRHSQGNFRMLTSESLPWLIRMKNEFPNCTFPGFNRWGPGDAGDPALNLENHFLKHVCDSTDKFLDEASWWWKALSITVRRDDLQPAAGAGELAYFKPDGSLDQQQLKAFIHTVVANRPALRQALFHAYQQAYTDYAFKMSRQLQNIIVESDGHNMVMISGFAGHVTIFGRFDSDVGPLGMSTCYFVVPTQRPAKLDPDKDVKMWSMKH